MAALVRSACGAPPFGAVYDWAINHLHQIEQAQEAYDKKTDR
jgi:hypothetical protein